MRIEHTPGGRARRNERHFSPRTPGGPAESRRSGTDWLTRDYGETRWRRWRFVARDLWELVDDAETKQGDE